MFFNIQLYIYLDNICFWQKRDIIKKAVLAEWGYLLIVYY